MGADSVGIRFIGHATVLIEVAGLRILTDPFLRSRLGPLVRHGPVPDPDALGPIDLVLVSHGHADHFDRASLGALQGRPTVVVPAGLREAARPAVLGAVTELRAGEDLALGSLRIHGVPARHWVTPGAPRAKPMGFVIDSGQRIYFAGDTGPFPAMADLAGTVDVALLPVWTWGPHLGPGHLGPRSAADVVALLGASVAIPIHWGTLYPRGLERAWRSPLDTPGHRFAAHAAAVAPDARIRVLAPGHGTNVDQIRVSGDRSPPPPPP